MKKILLIGDSIRMGYDKYVKLAFEGEAEVYYPDLTHPYTAGGAKLLTEQVVSVIEKALDIKGKQLNYEEFFEKKSNVLGI